MCPPPSTMLSHTCQRHSLSSSGDVLQMQHRCSVPFACLLCRWSMSCVPLPESDQAAAAAGVWQMCTLPSSRVSHASASVPFREQPCTCRLHLSSGPIPMCSPDSCATSHAYLCRFSHIPGFLMLCPIDLLCLILTAILGCCTCTSLSHGSLHCLIMRLTATCAAMSLLVQSQPGVSAGLPPLLPP